MAATLALLWKTSWSLDEGKRSDSGPALRNASMEGIADTEEQAPDKPSLKDIFRRSITDTEFTFPTHEEINAFESLLDHSIAISFTQEKLKSKWQALGWNLRFLDGNIVVIEEKETQRKGRGLYALRILKADPIMVQSPHRFYDAKTGVISRKLFEQNAIQAAAWNTVHRKEYDMAHQSRSFLNSFTRCVVKHFPDVTNFQLHGFARSKRKGDKAESPKTLAIVSNTTRSPDRMTKDFTREMKSSFGKDRIWLFPLETAELGATTNKQASVMRQQGSGNFIHLEMTKPFRNRLVNYANDRKTLYDAFSISIRKPHDLVKTGERAKGKMQANEGQPPKIRSSTFRPNGHSAN